MRSNRRTIRSQTSLHRRKRRTRGRKIRNPRRSGSARLARYASSAYQAGQLEGTRSKQEGLDPIAYLHDSWYAWCRPRMSALRQKNWRIYLEAAASYLHGYSLITGLYHPELILLPTKKKTAAIITVMNEEESVPEILRQLSRLPLHETVFVINGSEDRSFDLIRRRSQALIVHYRHPIGHDVGRAAGAKLVSADILLFLDADFPVRAERLLPFIDAVESGVDVALNNIRPLLPNFAKWDAVTTVKAFLNRALGRADLHANSLTAVPHALSRKAVETIGYRSLIVPPKAQARAILSGLTVGCPASVDVVTVNRMRKHNFGVRSPVSELIIGDHIEALRTAMDACGDRLTYRDEIRRRHEAGGASGG